jgi:hypothetical protein
LCRIVCLAVLSLACGFSCVFCRSKLDAVNSTRAKFIQPDGDQLTMLFVMRAYLEVDKRKRAEWASDNFVNVRCG